MLRRLTVRMRLMAVIAVPLVILLAVALPEALQRRSEAADADRSATISADIAQVSNAIDALQSERTLNAATRAGGEASLQSALRDQRTLTDFALDRAAAALGRLAALDPAVGEAAREATAHLETLNAVRADSDAADSIVPWLDPFDPLLQSLLEVQERVGAAASELTSTNEMSRVALLGRDKEAASAQSAQMAAASVWGELRGDQARALEGLRADEAAARRAYLAGSPNDQRNARQSALTLGAVTTAGRTVDEVVRGGPVPELGPWLDQSAARQETLRDAEAHDLDAARAAVKDVGTALRQSSNGYLVLAGGALLLALGLGLAVVRSITRPLRELTDAADRLADERLPMLVDALRHPDADDDLRAQAALEPIAEGADDELGHLAHAFNAVQSVAVDVAAEQSNLLRKGISDLYVNLARRNQALIDRQIQLLDQLEGGEEDPEVLQHLYLLDHLATRMRRNAESLLILAGSESGPRRSKPVSVVDVVRAALGEVEDYERVDIGVMADAVLHGPAVSDVAHLLAELLENATHFSPPDTLVRIDGARAGGGYQLVVTDRGVGMRPEQLEELNAVLRDPPVTGLALGRALGCLVAARLAARHDIAVTLRAGPDEGVTAYVVLPRSLLVEEGLGSIAPAPDTPRPTVADRDLPSSLSDALPTRSAFDEGIQALLGRDEALDDLAAEADLAVPEPAISAAAGLQRRTPGATTEAPPAMPDEPRVRRSPDEVRSLLSRYRSGLQAGRATDGPVDEERS